MNTVKTKHILSVFVFESVFIRVHPWPIFLFFPATYEARPTLLF